MKTTNKMGKAGNGTKVHAIYTGINVSDIAYAGAECGADFSNGSNVGQLNNLRDLDVTKVTCKKCIKRLK